MKKILTLTLCLALLLGLFSGCGGKQYDPLAGVETTVFTDDAGARCDGPGRHYAHRSQRLDGTDDPDDARAGAARRSCQFAQHGAAAVFPGGDVDVADVRPVLRQQGQPQHGGTDRRRAAAHRRPWRCQGERPQRYGRHPEADRYPDGLPRSDARRNAAGYRKLGRLLHREAEAEVLAVYLEQTLAMAAENSAKLPQDARKTVLFGTGATGLACNAEARYRRTYCRSSEP